MRKILVAGNWKMHGTSAMAETLGTPPPGGVADEQRRIRGSGVR